MTDFPTPYVSNDLKDRVALVTGTTSGLGRRFALVLAACGAKVALTGRRAERLDELAKEIRESGGTCHPIPFDITDEKQIPEVVDKAQKELGLVDILVNNAGILRRETLDNLDFDSIRAQFEVNALGPLRVTAALRTNLSTGSKVAIITSRMGSIADNTSGSRYGYRMSKAAVNMAGASLAHDMRHSGVAVALLHPGFVKTDMTGGMGDVSTETSVRGLVARIDGLELSNSGTFWHAQGQILPW